MNKNFWDFAITVAIIAGIIMVMGCADAIREEIVEERQR